MLVNTNPRTKFSVPMTYGLGIRREAFLHLFLNLIEYYVVFAYIDHKS